MVLGMFLVLIILSTILLLSWGYEIGEWIGAIIFVLVGIPLGILLFRKILLPFLTKIREWELWQKKTKQNQMNKSLLIYKWPSLGLKNKEKFIASADIAKQTVVYILKGIN